MCAVTMIAPTEAIAASAAQTSSKSGFELESKTYSDSYNGDILTYIHKKTGAEVVFIKNDDENKGFSIGFHTESSDDTGVAHVVEHSVISGSESVRSRDLFFDMSRYGYVSDMNAMTMNSSTVYYFSTLDSTQLYGYMDLYLDCCLNSVLLYDESVFSREGWHYELDDYSKDSELELNGIVYSEIGASSTIDTLVSDVNGILYGDTYLKYNSGGKVEDLPNLTYEDAVSFYKQYYTPSNSISLVYGNVDVERALEILDGYFSKFGKSEKYGAASLSESGKCILAKRTYPYMLTAGGTGYITYGIKLPDDILGENAAENIAAEKLIEQYLYDTNSPLMKNLYASGIAMNYLVEFVYEHGAPTLFIIADDAAGNAEKQFKAVIDKSFAQIKKNGVDKDLIRGYISQIELGNEISPEQIGMNVSNMNSAIYTLSSAAAYDKTELFTMQDCYSALKEKLDGDYFDKFFEQYTLGSNSKALIGTTPEMGGIIKQQNRISKKLKNAKSAMTDSELDNVITMQKNIVKLNTTELSDETREKLSVVKSSDINYEQDIYDVKLTKVNGNNVFTADVGNKELVNTSLFFDLSGMSFEDIYFLSEYISMLGLGTAKHSSKEIEVLSNENIYGLSASVDSNLSGEKFVPTLCCSFYAPSDKYKEAVELVTEMLRSTDLEAEKDYLNNVITQYYRQYQYTTVNSSRAVYDSKGRYSTYYAFIAELAGERGQKCAYDIYTLSQNNLDKVITKMQQVRKAALKSSGAEAVIITDKSNFSACRGALRNMYKELPSGIVETYDQNFTNQNFTRAYVDDYTGIDNTYLIYPLVGEYSDGCAYTAAELISNNYFLPELRLAHGAYDASASFVNGWMTWSTYSDPDYTGTVDIYRHTGDFLRGDGYTSEDLDAAKVSAISRIVRPSSDFDNAFYSVVYTVSGMPLDYDAQHIREIKATTMSDIKAFAEYADEVYRRGDFSVITTKRKINADQNFFDSKVA